MGFDVATIASILGILLTVAFFAIGYRQTIGARKERARAARKSAVDTLFRRLSLEPNFVMDRGQLRKVVEGWALDVT